MRASLLIALPLAALAIPSATAETPAVVHVQLANFKFTPNTILLDRGRPYVLRLTNVAGGGHNFVAPSFFAASRITPAERGKIVRGEIEVHPGMSHEVRLTAPASPGRYKVKCTHRFHKLLGMSGTIIVR